jgi:hypothetical protein
MADIVKKVSTASGVSYDGVWALLDEAVVEIKRLRKELRGLRYTPSPDDGR